MDLYTSLIGSGPAYIFYLIESLLEASEELEFENDLDLSDDLFNLKRVMVGFKGLEFPFNYFN